MDDRRFDSLAKSLAAGRNRRAVLKGILGLGGAAIAGGIAFDRDAEAARRPANLTPTPVRCPGSQVPCGSACCCPDGATVCGPDCCPTGAQCCDSACCYGTCYGEEFCCPADGIVCNGECLPWQCCTNADCPAGESTCVEGFCECVPACDGSHCGSDGCGGTCACASGTACDTGSGMCFPRCSQAGDNCEFTECSCYEIEPNTLVCLHVLERTCSGGSGCEPDELCRGGRCVLRCTS